jgi:hypothetical protein
MDQNMEVGKGFIMKARVLLSLAVLSLIVSSPTGLGAWRVGNVTEHSYIYLSGYIDEMKIYQTDKGLVGQKLVVGTRGSGVVDKRQTAYVDALCAKNYRIGTVISESYTGIEYLIKDTTIFQNDNVSVYQVASHGRGTARLGALVKDGPTGVTVMSYGGTYIGDFNIRQEIGSGSQLYLPCP